MVLKDKYKRGKNTMETNRVLGIRREGIPDDVRLIDATGQSDYDDRKQIVGNADIQESFTSVNWMRPASEINPAIAAIPKADLWDIYARSPEDTETKNVRMRGVVVAGELVSVVSDRYKLVQHEQAFRPVIEGLTVAGVQDFTFNLHWNKANANLSIYYLEADDGSEGIRFGFRVHNSVDGKSSIRYGFDMEKLVSENVMVTDRFVTVWGVRQVCQNGLMMRVPLDWVDVVHQEERLKIESLIKEAKSIAHYGEIEKKIKVMQYVTEAFVLLQKPIERILARSKLYEIENQEEARKLLKKYIGKRLSERILKKYDTEEGTLFGLWNAATWIASHDEKIKERTRHNLIEDAGIMLEKELRNPSN